MLKKTIDEFYEKINSGKNAVLSKQYKGVKLEEIGERIRVSKLPDSLSSIETNENSHITIEKRVLKLSKILDCEVFYDPLFVESVDVKEISDQTNFKGCVRFENSSPSQHLANAQFAFKVDDELFSEIANSRAINAKMLGELKDDLEYANGLLLLFTTRDALITGYRPVIRKKKIWIDTEDKVELSNESIQYLVLHINKRYKKAFRTKGLPKFDHFKDAFFYGVKSESIIPMSENQEINDFFKSIRCKLILNQPAPEFMSKLFFQELSHLELLIYDYNSPYIAAYDKNRGLILKAVITHFSKMDSDLSFFVKPQYQLTLFSICSKVLCEYYRKGVEHDLDRIIVANKKDNK